MSALRDQPTGVGGWLALFRVFCLLGGIFYLFSVVEWAFIPAAEWEKLAALAPAVVRFRLFSQVQSVVVAAGLFWTFYLLVRPRPTTALWALFTLTGLIALDTAGFLLQESFISSLTAGMRARGEAVSSGDFTEARSHVLLAIVGGLIWTVYFLRSRRVENTWGPQSLRAMLAWVRGGLRSH